MIMTPAPYSPHDLVTPWSHEPLRLALHCCAVLRCCWLLALGPYSQRLTRYSASIATQGLCVRQENFDNPVPLSLSLQRKSIRENNENGLELCPGTTIYQQCHYSLLCQQRQISNNALVQPSYKFLSLLPSGSLHTGGYSINASYQININHQKQQKCIPPTSLSPLFSR